jgi:hypothetical protein
MSTQESIASPTSPSDSGQINECKSCGNKFSGSFCNLCGEKVLEAGDRSLRTFMSNIQVTHIFADNRFLKSLKLIIIKPGFLYKEYADGRRVNYTKPLQVFFVLNLVYFLFPLVQLFNTSLNTQMYLRTHSPLVRELVQKELDTTGYSYQAYSLMYNDKSTGLAKLLIIVFVLLVSLPFNLIYRKRSRYFADHLALSVELVAFNLAMNATFLSLFLIAANNLIHWTHSGWEKYLDDQTLTIIFVLSNIYFLFSAGRVFYKQKGFKLIIKVLLGLLGIFIALEMYRMILFLVTYWTL